MRLMKTSGRITYLGYSAIMLTTIYTIIITVLGLKILSMVSYIYKSILNDKEIQ